MFLLVMRHCTYRNHFSSIQCECPRFSTLLIFLLLTISSTSRDILCQDTDLIFEQLFLEDGLSQSIVESILQDKKGFMYFGTEDGLNVYDGYRLLYLDQNPIFRAFALVVLHGDAC